MTKKELIEMISDVPDDARIQLVHTQYNLIDILKYLFYLFEYFELYS